MESRTVTALVSRGGAWLGSVGPFEVPGPWWSYAEAITNHLDEVLGVPTALVRLVGSDRERMGNGGGHVIYHAEALTTPKAILDGERPEDWAAILRDHPLRAPWARPSGPVELLDWAVRMAGVRLVGRPRQVKTWNLSCVYRLPTAGGSLWVKANARFSSDEAACVRLAHAHDPSLAPAVLAADRAGRRFVMGDAPGADCWEAGADTFLGLVRRWVAVQAAIARDGAEAPGIPQRPPEVLPDELPRLLDGEAGAQLTADELAAAWKLAGRLPELLAEVAAAGLPGTLVHGDLNPGNLRGRGPAAMIIDWADSYFGNPAADIATLAYWLPDGVQPDTVERAWVDAWRAEWPGCAPERALRPIRPLVQLMNAALYQRFLDGIEPTERLYHEGDPAGAVRAALRC
jgi:Phosphotransferase enzyme family